MAIHDKMKEEPGNGLEITKRKKESNKIIAVISIVWMFTFTAYSGLQNLQSSINPEAGTNSLATLTGGGVVAGFFAPAVLNYIGPKGALAASWICLCIYVGGNYYPESYILIPTAAVEGLSTGFMWTAQGVYITYAAVQYSQATGEKLQAVLSRYFGIFYAAFESTQISGNIISSVVLQNGAKISYYSSNFTKLCGSTVCPETTTILAQPSNEIIYILNSAYMAMTLAGLVITLVFLKPIKTTSDNESIGKSLLSPLKFLVSSRNMVFLVPLSLYTGLEQVIMYAEYTKAFVACELGVQWIGFTMVCFGVCNTIGAPLNGLLAKYVRRLVLLATAFLLNLGVLAGLMFWKPKENQMALFFVFPALWGIADSIWQTQTSTLVGYAFKDKAEPAFANLRLFQSLGLTLAFVYSVHLCTYYKLYIATGLLTLTIILVAIVEIDLRKKPNNGTCNDINRTASNMHFGETSQSLENKEIVFTHITHL